MRTFIAIELENHIKDYLKEAQGEVGKLCKRGNMTPRDNFHLTLHFVGETQQEEMEDLKEAVFETARRFRTFELSLDQIGFFPKGNKGVLWVGVKQNKMLPRVFEGLERNLSRQGFAREKKGLSPHITLGREVVPITNFLDLQKAVKIEEKIIEVKRISLMESVRIGAKLIYRPVFTSDLKD